jgi:hypothetical protein
MPTDPASTAAAELYALPPAEFTAARNTMVKDARSRGEKDTAQRIARFAKPSASAWAVNQLVRNDPDAVDELIGLGGTLREAQAEPDRDTLRALGTDRQKALAALSQRARELGASEKVGVSGSAIIEVGQTLQAAMTDPDAARAVQSGVLVRGLSSTGWEPADLDGALAIPLEGAAPAKAPRQAKSPKQQKPAEPSTHELAAERKEAQRRQDAEAEAARKEAEELERRLEKLIERRRAVEAEREALKDQLREVEDELSVIDRERASIRRDARRR